MEGIRASTIIWQFTVLVFGVGLLLVLWTYLQNTNEIKAEQSRVDCLIRSANIDSAKFDKANCYHILDYKSGFKNLK